MTNLKNIWSKKSTVNFSTNSDGELRCGLKTIFKMFKSNYRKQNKSN